jgi:hypothetical protein
MAVEEHRLALFSTRPVQHRRQRSKIHLLSGLAVAVAEAEAEVLVRTPRRKE